MKITNFNSDVASLAQTGIGSGTNATPPSPGVTDHGALSGLADDDHTQYVLTTEGGLDKSFPHGSMGSTETLDPTDGNVHTGTLDADCTLTISAPPTTRGGYVPAASLELWITQDGTGGWDLTVAATGGTVTDDGAITPDTTAGVTVRYILERVPGTTNDWIRNLVGGASAVAALDDLSDVTITSAAAADRLRFDGSEWRNSAKLWTPVMVEDVPSGLWYVVVTGDGDAVLTEV